jgi:hypothetical protein
MKFEFTMPKGDEVDRALRNAREHCRLVVLVGIQRDAGPHPVFGEGARTPVGFINTARLAAIHEYGGKLAGDRNISPARPFIGPAFDSAVELNVRQMSFALGEAMQGASGNVGLAELGRQQAERVKSRIIKVLSPPLASRTIYNRKRRAEYYASQGRVVPGAMPDTPVLDSGQIYQSIRFDIVNRNRLPR